MLEAFALASVLAASPADDVLPNIEGQRYWEVRASLLEAGFVPVASAERPFEVCVEEMASESYLDACPSEQVVLPEVQDCSGTGRGWCWLRLSWNERVLCVVTFGEPQPGRIDRIEWMTSELGAHSCP